MCCQESGEREATTGIFCPKLKPRFRKVRDIFAFFFLIRNSNTLLFLLAKLVLTWSCCLNVCVSLTLSLIREPLKVFVCGCESSAKKESTVVTKTVCFSSGKSKRGRKRTLRENRVKATYGQNRKLFTSKKKMNNRPKLIDPITIERKRTVPSSMYSFVLKSCFSSSSS